MFSKRLLFLLFTSTMLVIGIPGLGYFSASIIQSNFDKKFLEALQKDRTDIDPNFSMVQTCTTLDTANIGPEISKICSELEQFNLLEYWSIVAGIVGMGFLFLAFLAGVFGQLGRTALATIFKPALRLSQLTVSFLVIAHGSILIAAIYYSESYWLGKVHFILLGIAGLAIFGTALKALVSTFSQIHAAETTVLGRTITRKDEPKLWNVIDEVATLAKTKSPDNLIVGLSPTFFVTEAKVKSLDGSVNGSTIYLSLPFCRLLSINELKAIIAHEMGHFVGYDTKFSRHFYPIYKGATTSLLVLSQHTSEGGIQSVAALPSTFLMAYFLETFTSAERKFSRIREFDADALGAKLVSKEDMASSLVKVHAYSNVWPYTESKMLDALSAGKQLVNASDFFELVATNLPLEFISKGLDESQVAHPTDTHPTLSSRLERLSHKLEGEWLSKAVAKGENCASTLVTQLDALEKQLTEFEHEKIVKSSGVVANQNSADASFRQILLRSMILMVLADENVSDEEISSMKSIFEKITDEKLSDAEIKLEISKIKEWAGSLFDYLKSCEILVHIDAKKTLLKALWLLALSDGEFHKNEKDLMVQVTSALGVDVETVDKIVSELFDKRRKVPSVSHYHKAVPWSGTSSVGLCKQSIAGGDALS